MIQTLRRWVFILAAILPAWSLVLIILTGTAIVIGVILWPKGGLRVGMRRWLGIEVAETHGLEGFKTVGADIGELIRADTAKHDAIVGLVKRVQALEASKPTIEQTIAMMALVGRVKRLEENERWMLLKSLTEQVDTLESRMGPLEAYMAIKRDLRGRFAGKNRGKA